MVMHNVLLISSFDNIASWKLTKFQFPAKKEEQNAIVMNFPVVELIASC